MTDSPRIYRYVVRYDSGSAPNPYGGYCTLAICKPAIRRTARPGDWIIGFHGFSGKHDTRHEEICYVMQVSESLSYAEYWEDLRFRSRRPSKKKRSTPLSDSSPPDDNIYLQAGAGIDGDVELKQARVYDGDHKESSSQQTDKRGKNVLIGTMFWYFGDQSKELPQILSHLGKVGRGHVVNKYKEQVNEDLEQLKTWLGKFKPGRMGTPRLNKKNKQASTVVLRPNRSRC